MLVVGVDSGKDRVDAVAMRDKMFVSHYSHDLAKTARADQMGRGDVLQSLRHHLISWITQLKPTSEETCLFAEEPIVYTHDQRVAVLIAETVGMLLALPYHTDVIPISSWKMIAVGSGSASKNEVREAIALRFPDTVTLFGKRQDLFDATGVAICGCTRVSCGFGRV